MIHIDNNQVEFNGNGESLYIELACLFKKMIESGYPPQLINLAVEAAMEYTGKKDSIQDRIERILKELKASEDEDMEMKIPDDDKPDTFNSVFGNLFDK